MNVNREILDYESAGALAEELPYWGWLEDGRSCLTRGGELVSLARLSPTVLDGHTPEQLDRILARWQRMLSGLDSRTRLYFYLLRRPSQFAAGAAGQSSDVAALSQRKRRAFLAERVQEVQTYLAWCHNPQLSSASKERLEQALVEGLRPELVDAEAQPSRIGLSPLGNSSRYRAVPPARRCVPRLGSRLDSP